jgi:hypothetical protein
LIFIIRLPLMPHAIFASELSPSRHAAAADADYCATFRLIIFAAR